MAMHFSCGIIMFLVFHGFLHVLSLYALGDLGIHRGKREVNGSWEALNETQEVM